MSVSHRAVVVAAIWCVVGTGTVLGAQQDWSTGGGPSTPETPQPQENSWETQEPLAVQTAPAPVPSAEAASAAGEPEVPAESSAVATAPTVDSQAEALTRQGEALLEQGSADAAIEQFERALQAQPTSAGFHGLGMAYLAKHQQEPGEAKWLERAEEALAKAVELEPNYSTANIRLGMLLVQRGRREDGASYIRRGLAMSPEHSLRDEALRLIEEPSPARRSSHGAAKPTAVSEEPGSQAVSSVASADDGESGEKHRR